MNGIELSPHQNRVTKVLGAARQHTLDITERASRNLESLAYSSACWPTALRTPRVIKEHVQKNLDRVNARRSAALPSRLEE
jgi:hypothetical protein